MDMSKSGRCTGSPSNGVSAMLFSKRTVPYVKLQCVEDQNLNLYYLSMSVRLTYHHNPGYLVRISQDSEHPLLWYQCTFLGHEDQQEKDHSCEFLWKIVSFS